MPANNSGPIADYDAFAWFYHHHWAHRFTPLSTAMIDHALRPHLPEQASVLDVCCGSGEAAHELSLRKHRVTGLDASDQMVRYARQKSPKSHFFCADARRFRLKQVFHGAISTFDSVNHFLSPEDLSPVFSNVQECLRRGGVFVFDALMEEAYQRTWNQSGTLVDADYACFIRGGYDSSAKSGITNITLFRKSPNWERTDTSFRERCYSPEQITELLHGAGFSRVECVDAHKDLGVAYEFSSGRAVFLATASTGAAKP